MAFGEDHLGLNGLNDWARSDEALCDRWVENPYFQYFCGEEFFQHALVLDRSSLTRWRQRMG
jgi:IS5 family transposase